MWHRASTEIDGWRAALLDPTIALTLFRRLLWAALLVWVGAVGSGYLGLAGIVLVATGVILGGLLLRLRVLGRV